jgi:TPR repeat protein
MSLNRYLNWDVKAEKLKLLMYGINANNGIINCGHVALRLDDYLHAGRNLGLPPVPTVSASMRVAVSKEIDKERPEIAVSLKKCFTENIPLLLRCAPLNDDSSNSTLIDLTDDKKTIIYLNCFSPTMESQLNPRIYLKKASIINIHKKLQQLPRSKTTHTAQGFIIFIWKNRNVGHISNFFVDEEDHVFFLDAQNPDLQVRYLPSIEGYWPEIFYLQSIPPEGLMPKVNLDPTYKAENLPSLTSEEKQNIILNARTLLGEYRLQTREEFKPNELNLLWAAATLLITDSATQSEALSMLIIGKDAGYSPALTSLAKFYLTIKRSESPTYENAAHAYLRLALEKDPNNQEALLELAIYYTMKDENSVTGANNRLLGLNLFFEVLQNNILNVAALLGIARCLRSINNPRAYCQSLMRELSIAALGLAHQLEPTNIAVLTELTNLYKKDNAENYCKLAQLFIDNKTIIGTASSEESAYRYFLLALETDPNNLTAIKGLARFFWHRIGLPIIESKINDSLALFFLNRIHQLEPNNVEAVHLIARCYSQGRGVARNIDKWREYLDKALKLLWQNNNLTTLNFLPASFNTTSTNTMPSQVQSSFFHSRPSATLNPSPIVHEVYEPNKRQKLNHHQGQPIAVVGMTTTPRYNSRSVK